MEKKKGSKIRGGNRAVIKKIDLKSNPKYTLQVGEYPDYYGEIEEVIEERGEVRFVGQKEQLDRMWRNLVRLSKLRGSNVVMIGTKRLGKTRLFLRFYNVTFWYQDVVVPLYYCFPNKKTGIEELVRDMAETFIKQWMGFVFKDPSWVKLGDRDKIYEKLEELEEGDRKEISRIIKVFDESCDSYIRRESVIYPQRLLGYVWKVISK